MGHMAPDRLGIDAIVGKARRIEELRDQIARLVGFDAPRSRRVPTVLLEGETGTGKGLVARVMHDSGPRAAGAFVDVNCAAIPEAMLEAELFGFEAGAFTDAKRAKPGLFESASGGTLFLDEIDSLSIPVQSKVLKAIEEKSVRRLGALSPAAVDVKLIAATQKDLRAEIAAGAFRADLYHRLAVLVLTIPPLREREGDGALLAERFLRDYAAAHGLEAKQLGDDARAWLERQPWPGNVRELAHLMERVTLLCPEAMVGERELAALAIEPPAAPLGRQTDAAAAASDPEAARIRAALARTGGTVLRAARLLGLGRNALRYRMRRLGIGRDEAMEGLAAPAGEHPSRRGAGAAAPAAPHPGEPAFEAALQIAERIGYRRGVWQAYRSLAECARRAGAPSRAEELSARAARLAAETARGLGDDDLRRRILASAASASG
jgi:transcriptional regulator with PAS, ATPase and Fis domain